ncbi:hypothetical protein [Micromonospora sp. ALFpr18c]|nr:hypothetical protein [Micromonospora sp. ALFpr18c]
MPTTLAKALARLRRGDTLVITRLSRLFRSLNLDPSEGIDPLVRLSA